MHHVIGTGDRRERMLDPKMLVLRLSRSDRTVPYGEQEPRDSITFHVLTSDEAVPTEEVAGVAGIQVHRDVVDGTSYVEDQHQFVETVINQIGDWMMAALVELMKEEKPSA